MIHYKKIIHLALLAGFSLSGLALAQNIPTAKPRVPVGGENFDISAMTPEQRAQYEAYVNGVQTITPPNINTYPSYNKPGQGSILLMPVALPMPGDSGNSPVVISAGGGGTQIVKVPGPSSGEVVNSLMKTMLLTNLSGS